jgi:uncharacterized protein YjiS (DUF1127 family)
MSNSFLETYVPHTGSYASSLWALLAKAIGRQAERIRHQRQVRHDINGLMELNDRALADIGLSRCEVMYAVANGGLSEHKNDRVVR